MHDLSSQGLIFTFGVVPLGRAHDASLTEGHENIDLTDFSHERENNQPGITTVSGSIDCYGDPVISQGDIGGLVVSGTWGHDYGLCKCDEVTAGPVVKGARTTRYTFSSAAEGGAT